MYAQRTDFYIWDSRSNLIFESLGIEFIHKGEEIIWIWPWRRKHINERFLSLIFEGIFPSLASLDEEWEGYFKAEQEIADGDRLRQATRTEQEGLCCR